MGSEAYAEVSLADIADFRNGKAIPPEKYTPNGKHPVFGSNGQIACSDEVLCPDPTIVIGRVGAYCGCVHYVPTASWVTDNAIVASPQKGNDLRYLYYLLGSLELERTAIGSAQPLMTQKGLKVVQTKVPPLPEQKAIAHILGSLDDKIELNRKMNATLEAMAQALFKSWFVDFDPVIDNALRAGNPIPPEFQARAELRRLNAEKLKSATHHSTLATQNSRTAHLFPDSFQETEELGWIPEGWEVRELRAITSKISKGTTPRKSETTEALDPEIIPFLKVRDITDNGDLKDSDFDLIPRSIHEKSLKRSILTTGDVLFSIAGTIGRVTIVPSELNDSNINQAIAFIRPDGSINSMFILEHLRGSYVQDRIHSRVVQAVQANISLTEIGDIPVPIPSAKIHDAWLTNTTEIYQKIATLKLLNRSLTKLRDTLLPKLISGELRVSAP
tara:strand:+ start:969 stop:2303 length:1335 start_codon:yes stop_codon:yes gene_type:complete